MEAGSGNEDICSVEKGDKPGQQLTGAKKANVDHGYTH